jgi:hypothetical protein
MNNRMTHLIKSVYVIFDKQQVPNHFHFPKNQCCCIWDKYCVGMAPHTYKRYMVRFISSREYWTILNE